MNTFFNLTTGELINDLPPLCVEQCSASGAVDSAVEYWQQYLKFNAPRLKSIAYLKSFGSWTEDELKNLTNDEISQKILWVFCGDIADGHQPIGVL